MTGRRPAVIATALSIALHMAALMIWRGTAPAPEVRLAPPATPRVEIEVMRLSGLVGRQRPTAPAPVAAPAPIPARPMKRELGTDPVPSAAAAPVAEAPRTDSASAESGSASLSNADAGDGTAGSASVGSADLGGPSVEPTLDTSALSRRLQQVALACYPPAARRFGQTGETVIHFCLDAKGALRETIVRTSSGSAFFDAAARDCVVPGAAPFGPETFGRCFTVPVRFGR